MFNLKSHAYFHFMYISLIEKKIKYFIAQKVIKLVYFNKISFKHSTVWVSKKKMILYAMH